MKLCLFLLTILATTFSYSQDAIHFLYTTEGNYQVTEPLCLDMIEQTKSMMQKEKKKIQAAQKSGRYDIKKAGLIEAANFELLQKLVENPEEYFPLYVQMIGIFRAYENQQYGDNIYASFQEVSLKELGKPNIQINIRNVVVSPSATSLDMDIIDLSKANEPKVSKHFSCATSQLLQFEQAEARWFFFWQQFYAEVKLTEWLDVELYQINEKLISQKQRYAAIETKLTEQGMNTESYLQERVQILRNKLKGYPNSEFSFDTIKGILMSQDQSKFVLLTQHEFHDVFWHRNKAEDTVKVYQLEKWQIQFNSNGAIEIKQNGDNTVSWERLNAHKNMFYSTSLTDFPLLTYNEALWVAFYFERGGSFIQSYLLQHESQSKETSQLIKTYVEPLLNQLVNDSSQYNNFYQQMTADNINEYNFDEQMQPTIVKDYLISNPEKTAFIYPVLLQHRSVQEREYYYTQEDFKFYVLLKNEQGTFDLYDWHYFSALPYKNYYSLLTCAHSHLEKISNWDGESDIINDPAFWNDFVAKKSDRGYDYLTLLVSKEQSPMIARSEFEAQVKDCYKLLSEQDVADLYPNQLKQVILCLNTIQTFNLKGKDETQLAALATQIYFEKRLNKVQKYVGNYYPIIHLEFGGNLQPHSYYLLK
jgi:hypothetical protein